MSLGEDMPEHLLDYLFREFTATKLSPAAKQAVAGFISASKALLAKNPPVTVTPAYNGIAVTLSDRSVVQLSTPSRQAANDSSISLTPAYVHPSEDTTDPYAIAVIGKE